MNTTNYAMHALDLIGPNNVYLRNYSIIVNQALLATHDLYNGLVPFLIRCDTRRK